MIPLLFLLAHQDEGTINSAEGDYYVCGGLPQNVGDALMKQKRPQSWHQAGDPTIC
jgi:hypothetical protein